MVVRGGGRIRIMQKDGGGVFDIRMDLPNIDKIYARLELLPGQQSNRTSHIMIVFSIIMISYVYREFCAQDAHE